MSAADQSLASGAISPSDVAQNQTNHDTQALDSFSYDDRIVRMFMTATIFWGFVATSIGLIVGLLLVVPNLWNSLDPRVGEYLSFGRLRPLHTNAAIFAFAGNAIFAAIYYSTQRLCKARMWSDFLSHCHFWGWQAIIVAAAITLPLGITQSKEYAELEWPIDLAIAVVWAGFFGINFMMTLIKRRERHMYVALWFYIATLVTVTVLHVFNNLIVPIGLFAGVPEAVEEASRLGEPLTVSQQFWWKSYSVYAGVQDALMQWWYGHNAVAFFLTTPFLGLMYYFLPKAADRPVFSYKLSIIHFWSLVFIYIWAGPHHLHYTALPEWASTFGMLFSVMLWMPSWGGMINGLLTLRGAWHKVTTDPVLKFFVVGITFYGMATFEGPLLSVKSVNALSHYTDWTIAHVHAGALGWNGFMTFGMIYWLLPRLFQTKLWSKSMAEWHFWLGTLGILLYIIPIYIAGITQGLMWRGMDELGRLEYPDFIESVTASAPFWWARLVGGSLFVFGIVMLGINAFMTWLNRPAKYDVPVYLAPRLGRDYQDQPLPGSKLAGVPVLDTAAKLEKFSAMDWHRRWERLPVRFTVLTTLAVIVASLFEIIPMFLIRSNVPTIATVKPYTPLELAGRDIYVSEGCYNCHSQMIRPMVAETQRYGEFSKAGEFIYDRPFQWGSRRIGPDLAREGEKQSSFWHWKHFEDPSSQITGSVMPSYKHLMSQRLNFNEIPARVKAAAYLNAPYDEELTNSIEMAKKQAEQIAADIIAQGGPVMHEGNLIKDTTAIALIAYIQRLGRDLFKTEAPADAAGDSTSEEGEAEETSEE